jgi:large subunit ribosomal protein L9
MQILLTQSIPKIGNKGDIVTVSEGYGRNYILKKRLGIIPKPADIARYQKTIQQISEQKQIKQQQLKDYADILADTEISLNVKTNEKGHLFGAIKESDIVDVINDQYHILLDTSMIIIDAPIKSIGKYTITIQFNHPIIINIFLYVHSNKQ